MEELFMSENQFGDHSDRPVRDGSTAHVALALVLDVSGSMNIDGRIQSLNDAVNDLINQINADSRLKNIIDLGIFVFGETGRDPVYLTFRAMSDCEQVHLEATDGRTYVVNALNTAVDRLRERTIQYSKGGGAHKPWIVLITDGAFDDSSALSSIGNRMKQREQDGKLQFFGLGVSGYNRGQLESLTNKPDHIIDVRNTKNFTEFLSWVGRSMATISNAEIGADLALGPVTLSGYRS
jgi:uncharacterized protein YegL